MSLMPSARMDSPYRSAASREQMAARLTSPWSRTFCAAIAVFAASMAVKPCAEMKAEHCGIGMAAAIYDLFRLSGSKNTEEIMPEAERVQGIQRLILLDEEGKPIKSWDLQGKISLIIGKAGRDQELDIDLSDCEYSSFIDFQHAVLNFCLDQWYVEDLGSQNGVKVGKVEDGECYRVIHRPCKVVAGDVLYIANTKLLLT